MSKFAAMVLVCLAFGLGSARAEDAETTVECDDARTACDDAMLAACPEGANVRDEKLSAKPVEGAPARKHYVVRYTCASATDANETLAGDLEAATDTEALAPAPREPIATEFAQPMKAQPRSYPHTGLDYSGDRRTEAAKELRHIEARLEELKRERAKYSPAGPTVVTIIGTVGFAAMLGGAIIMGKGQDDGLYNQPSESERAQRNRERKLLLGGSVVCGVAAVGGLIWLARMSQQRGKSDPEYQQLKRRRRDILRYDLAFDPLSRELVFSGRF